jgi:BON domain-containing protein
MRSLNMMAAILLAAAAGWSAGTPAVAPKPATTKASPTRVKPDAEIEKEIRAKFAKSKINQDKFQVHVQGGVATIEGKSEVIQHKGVATRLAKGAGAVAVANHIQISEAARDKAAENLETGRRRAQVKRSDTRSQ